MTEKQCKEALLRGQGRCLQAVRQDPEKFRNVVLWACSHLVAFDPQCEGCKSVFVYELICCYDERQPFVDILVDSLRKSKSGGGWKTLYFAEVLSHFAAEGYLDARQALWEKYEALYAILLKKKRRPEGIFPQRDDFAMICQVLGQEKTAMIRIAEDIGRLYATTDLYDGTDFDWLFDSWGKTFRRTLEARAKKSEYIRAYLQAGVAAQNIWEQPRPPQELPAGPALSRWLARKADPETMQQYAQAYLDATDPEARLTALKAFCRCPFPLDPAPILLDTQSEDAALQSAAWRALENIRHPAVREFAITRLEQDIEQALPVYITNCTGKDANILVELVKSIKVDFASTTMWHSIHLDVILAADRGVKVPKELLQHIYETSYCACCREYTLCHMGKRRMLTAEILEECLLDSNTDIRDYAKNVLKRRMNGRNN